MSVLLLILGALTTAGGLAFLASGATAPDGPFNMAIVTPGTIACVGGLLLIGMGLAVRQLRRIEKVLAARPLPRATQSGETSAGAAAQSLDASPRIPLPPKLPSDSNPQAAAPSANTAAATSDDAALEQLRSKLPTLAGTEHGPLVDAKDVSLMPRPPGAAEEPVKEAIEATQTENVGAVARNVPRSDAKVRSSPAPKRKGTALNAFWPIAPRRSTQTAAAPIVAPEHPPLPPVATREMPAADAAGRAAAAETVQAQVSVLKSGVVEGMAYTLYSDGSIEAQLPQGKLRFGSIAALRNHIESGA